MLLIHALRLFLLAIALSMASADDDYDCGTPHLTATNRIVDGTPIIDGEFPFLVYIYVALKASYDSKICTGSIISHRHILTAGHCAPEGANITVIYGTSNRTSQVHRLVSKATIVPGFVPSTEEEERCDVPDLSILEVPERIEFNERTGRVCLPKAYPEVVGSQATVVGWGYNGQTNDMQDFTENPPVVAEKNDVLIFEPDMCKTLGNVNMSFTICAGGHQTGTEGGDSGGPMVVNSNGRYFLIGTTTYGSPEKGSDGRYQDIGGYMRVATFCEWIEAVTENEAKCLDMAAAPQLRS